MTSIIVAAIPADDEPVWEFSSEKKPHMTLLYMEAPMDADLEAIVKYVEHAVDVSLDRFGMSVDRRGTLGKDDADVLFFDEQYESAQLRKFRAYLLRNDTIAKHYVKAEQFPGWVPHLTMGYPETPAKEVSKEDRYALRWINFDRIAVWTGEYDGPEFQLNDSSKLEPASHSVPDGVEDLTHSFSEEYGVYIVHSGVKGMRWGVRRDEKALGSQDKALNISQRSQVRVASTISALAAVGMSTNAAATVFRLQSRWEHYKVAKSVMENAENNPLINDAGREALRQTKNDIVRGIIGSALATTAVSIAIGVVTQRTAKAYFAPVHKVYADVKPRINGDLRKLGKDIKSGKRPKMTVKDYHTEVSKIVERHMTKDKGNLLSPFHELARNQMGLQYNTKKLNIKFQKLPNTDLYEKMTVTTPDGLKLVKAVKVVKHADISDEVGDVDMFFDYSFDDEGFIDEWSCPTLEVANDMFENDFDLEAIISNFDEVEHSLVGGETLCHYGRLGMRWGVRRAIGASGLVVGNVPTIGKKLGVEVPGIKGKASSDHKLMKKNLDKDVSSLTTDEIREITKRIKAVNEFKAATAAEKEKTKSRTEKIARWALGQVVAGAKKQASSYIQEATSDLVKDILPKTKSQKLKDKEQAEKKKASNEEKSKADKKKSSESDKESPQTRDRAVNELVEAIMDDDGVFKVTDANVKKGG